MALGIVLSHLRHHLSLPSVLLLYLLAVVVVAAVGGLWAALATAVVSFLVVNWFFTPPLYACTIAETENLLALFAFLAVAAIASGLVSLPPAEPPPVAGARPRRWFGWPLDSWASRGPIAFNAHAVADHVLTVRPAAVLVRDEAGRWKRGDRIGEPMPTAPDEADTVVELGDDARLALVGPALAGRGSTGSPGLQPRSCRRPAGAAQAASRGRHRRPCSARPMRPLRTASPRAVSHDLRTPLASIKASATSPLASRRGLYPGRNQGAPARPSKRRPFGSTVWSATSWNDAGSRAVHSTSRRSRFARGGRCRPAAAHASRAARWWSPSRRTSRIDGDPALLERAVDHILTNLLVIAAALRADRRGRFRRSPVT